MWPIQPVIADNKKNREPVRKRSGKLAGTAEVGTIRRSDTAERSGKASGKLIGRQSKIGSKKVEAGKNYITLLIHK